VVVQLLVVPAIGLVLVTGCLSLRVIKTRRLYIVSCVH
jgi:hypothetical protein